MVTGRLCLPRLVLIADLHLSAQHPLLSQGFIDLLKALQSSPTALYILGDWFDAWLADDDPSAWLMPIVNALQDFTSAGNRVYFLCGNRDFILGQDFLNRFGGVLLTEPYVFVWHGLRLRLEHGDALCTDDVAYQRYKKIIRHPWLLRVLKSLPLAAKRYVAAFFRRHSQQRQSQTMGSWVDVNAAEVVRQMADIEVLIHGHTHKPAIQHFADGKQRVVLGDWREHSRSAQVLILETPERIALSEWRF